MWLKSLFKPFLSRENKPVWFIMIGDKKIGPLSINDLKKNTDITPLTLVWKKGFEKWVPLGSVDELRKIFEKRIDQRKKDHPPLENGLEIVMEEGRIGFFPSIWWLLLTVFILAYILIKLWLML